ncbi:HAMP domain-containing sensor histidine kinase [Aurantivibrio infirmus]
MMKSLTLRQRFILACVILSAVIAIFFSSVLSLVLHSLENELMSNAMGQQTEWLIELDQQNTLGEFSPPDPWKLHKSKTSDESEFPELFRGRAPGFHEIVASEKDYHIYVVVSGAIKYILSFDQTNFETRENQIKKLLAFMVFLSISLGYFVAKKLTNTALKPVTNLAKQVSEIDPNHPGPKLSSYYNDDVVGQLANEFDQQIKMTRYYYLQEKLFTGDVSHELLTPITIIAGAVDILKKEKSHTDKGSAAVKRIENATSDMVKLVNAFLNLSKKHVNDREQRTQVSVNSLVASQILIAKETVPSFGNNCRFTENAVLQINVISSLLEVVVRNLIHNAASYAGSGEIRVTINKDNVVIQDSGSGIPQKILNRIFKESSQPDDYEVQGHGLGLAIVKRICDISEWRIETKSDQHGTTFSISFPAQQLV